MHRFAPAAALGCASLLIVPTSAAFAHAVAGARVFPVTLTIDDPGVADEASLPTFTWQRSGANGGPGPVNQFGFGGEFDKRITDDLGIGINDAYILQSVANGKNQSGWQDVSATLKYQAYVNAPHEFIVSLGVIREFGRTGSPQIGADEVGNTTPTLYFGKGFGDLPIGWLRPFAITGTSGFSIADRGLKLIPGPPDPDTGLATQQFNDGYANRYVGGVSLQYSIPYLQSQVKHLNLPDFVGRMIPVVELSFSTPTSRPNNLGTQFVIAPGVLYLADTYQIGVEALIPGNKASGTNVGVIAQFHVFFDDLFPNTLGKPLFSD